MAINYNEEEFGLQIPNEEGVTDVAFKEGSALDRQINKLNELEQLGFPQPNLQNLKEMDMKQFQETGTPLSLPEDQYAMAISNYDQLFGPTTMTDAFGTSYNIPGVERPDLYTGLMDAKTGVPVNTRSNRPTMADIAGEINENLIDRGNPLGDPRIASEEQGLSGFPGLGQVDPGFQNALNAREARMNEIAMQQDPNYGQFFNAPAVNEKKSNVFNDLLGLAALAYTGPYKGAVKAGTMLNNLRTGRLGKVVDTARGIPAAFAKKMRGVNPVTGRANTQAQWEQARADRQAQSRTDRMIDRIASGKRTRSNPRDAGKTQAQKDAISAAIQDAARTGQSVGDRNSGGNTKIVCTMMNERYGFGSFRNKIWMKFHENHGPEYQKGYHTIFLPLVKIAKGEGKLNTAVRKVLEHMGRHVTADMFKIMKGKKRDTLGRIYRAIFEPTCRIIGKIKSALGRG